MDARHRHTPRPYQAKGRNKIYSAWHVGHRNVLYVLATGGGKTFTFANIMHEWNGASCAVAHREELVGQISLALAREGVVHKIIAPDKVIKGICQIHMEELGQVFYNPRATCAVAGVDTLASWAKTDSKQYHMLKMWAAQVTLWVMDEAHHVLKENKWGKAVDLFPNAYGLGVTATPERADGKGLGRGTWDGKSWSNDGVFDAMVIGPAARDLINGLDDGNGGVKRFLTDYRVFCPPSNLDLASVSTGADGDYIRKQLALKTKESTVLGDVVTHYLRIAPGKLGLTFVPDTATAAEVAARFNAAGVPAEVVTAKTPSHVRRDVLRRFRKRQLLQLVSVDIFGEGFDLPAIEVVSFARATESYGLYVQMFGRSLRLLAGKEWAIIIDHVGNVLRHGLPDRPRRWTLDRRDRRSKPAPEDTVPMRNCVSGVHFETGEEMVGCFQPYEATYTACPYCGCKRVPAGRTAPDMVDGDLFELDADTLAAMRGEVERVDRHRDDVIMQYAHMGAMIAGRHAKDHDARQAAQATLRETMGWWGAWRNAEGLDDRRAQKLFYLRFGLTTLEACALNRADAEALTERVRATLPVAQEVAA